MTEDAARSPEERDLPHRRLADLIGGYQASAAIGALARLGVADTLAARPLTGPELAARLGVPSDRVTRLLDATLDLGLFTLDEERRYHLTGLGELLRADVPGSQRRYALASTEPWRWYAYCHLEEAVRTGEPGLVFAHGCGFWDYLASHPEAASSFDNSMGRIGAARDQAVLRAVDFARFHRVVDVGGGRGDFLCLLLAAYPQLEGVLFDLPAVVERARPELRQGDLAGRCQIAGGDFREAVPAGGDLYVLSWILHDWEDEAAQQILRSCRKAMKDGAHLLVVEMIVPQPNQPGAEAARRLVRQADLEMLAVVGGRERTAAEFRDLLEATGFVISLITPLEGMPWSVIEAVVSDARKVWS